MNDIKIYSANCQGLGDYQKRKDVFNYLRNTGANIFCLQDTHFTIEKENLIRSEWGHKCFFSSFSSNARGVAIFMNTNFEFEIYKEKKDPSGNFLLLDMSIEKHKLTLVAIYAPNSDNPQFLQNLDCYITDFGNDSYIICGDFNLVLDPYLDCYNYRHINNPNARKKLLELIESNSLIDPFRQSYPELRRYTWRKKIR